MCKKGFTDEDKLHETEAARKAVGLPVTERLMHTVMVGNPGTGKTTVARLMASALHEIGLLSKGHLVECNRENLTDSYIGGTEKKRGK